MKKIKVSSYCVLGLLPLRDTIDRIRAIRTKDLFMKDGEIDV